MNKCCCRSKEYHGYIVSYPLLGKQVCTLLVEYLTAASQGNFKLLNMIRTFSLHLEYWKFGTFLTEHVIMIKLNC